jgi:ADP-ribose pyrophosphatase YjhB (NUDIX family)
LIKFCRECGRAVEARPIEGKLRAVCPACGTIHFDDPKVAAVAFIERIAPESGVPQVLLVQRANDPGQGKWGLPAGFVDRGEDPADGAVREVAEETGLQVVVTKLLDVIFNDHLVIAIIYAATITGGVLVAADDAADARWFGMAELPDLAFESTTRTLDAWRARLAASVD